MKKFIFLIYSLIYFFTTASAFAEAEENKSPTVIFASKGNDRSITTLMDVSEQYLKNKKKKINAVELNLDNPLIKNPVILAQTMEKVKSLNPKLILSIGLYTTKIIAKNISDTPIVFAKVQKNDADILKIINRKTTGVLQSLFLEEKINLLKEMFPQTKNLGIIIDLEKNKKSVYDIKIIVRNLKLNPVIINVTDAKSLHKELVTNIDKTDAIMLLPSETDYSKEATKLIAAICAQKNKPLIGYTPTHVENGALFAVYEDNIAQAIKTATIMERILNFESPTAIPFETDESYFTALNVKIAKKTNATISSALLDKIDIVIK